MAIAEKWATTTDYNMSSISAAVRRVWFLLQRMEYTYRPTAPNIESTVAFSNDLTHNVLYIEQLTIILLII